MSTQWRFGAMGPTGLVYSSLDLVRRSVGVPDDDWPEVFEQVRILEDAALAEIGKAAAAASSKRSR